MAKDITQFDNVYYDLSEASGRLRLAASGLGWKQRESEGPPVTFAGSDIRSAAWSRTGRGFELRLGLRNGNAVVFDGFEGEDHKAMEEAIRRNLDIPLETVEHSLRGWNWGKTAFRGREFVFSVAGRPAFEIPVGRVSNSNLTGRNEVSLEFQLGRDDPQSGKSAQVDELAEMRIYVPGTVDDEGPGSDAGEGEEGETLAAQVGGMLAEGRLTRPATVRYDSRKSRHWRGGRRFYCGVCRHVLHDSAWQIRHRDVPHVSASARQDVRLQGAVLVDCAPLSTAQVGRRACEFRHWTGSTAAAGPDAVFVSCGTVSARRGNGGRTEPDRVSFCCRC